MRTAGTGITAQEPVFRRPRVPVYVDLNDISCDACRYASGFSAVRNDVFFSQPRLDKDLVNIV